MGIVDIIKLYIQGDIIKAKRFASAEKVIFIRLVFALINEFGYVQDDAIAIAKELKYDCFTNGIF